MATFPGDIDVQGDAFLRGAILPAPSRSFLAQDNLQVFKIQLASFRIWDAFHTNLPGTSATDDLALIGGTFATLAPSIQTYDLQNATATLYARVSIPLPVEYVAAQTIVLRFHAGMITNFADGSATLDVQAYESIDGAALGISADLCTTAAQSINSTTLADKDFIITPTALSPGDILDVRVTIAIVDTATGAELIGVIGSAALLADIKG